VFLLYSVVCLLVYHIIATMAAKRSSTSAASPAKKAKTAAPEAPLMSFLNKCDDIPKPCKEMLQTAVPQCLAVTGADRHKFQSEIVDYVASVLATEEGKRREAVATEEAALKGIEAETAEHASVAEAKKAAAAAKKGECDEKKAVVNAAKEASDAAKKMLTDAKTAEKAFNEKKKELLSEQGRFAKLLADVFQPMKEGALKASGHKRNKLAAELKKKLVELGAQQTLGDAIVSISKMTPEKQKGSFAQVSLKFAEEYFTAHTAKVAKDIAGLDEEANGIAAAIAAADAKVTETKAALEVVQKEFDEIHEVWEKSSGEASEEAKVLKQFEAKVPRSAKSVEKAQTDLTKVSDLLALFSKLKEEGTAVPQEPEEAAQEDTAAGEEGEPAAEDAKPDDEEM
jgi:chromosome segregation ATPase